jgi:hypothetical protein
VARRVRAVHAAPVPEGELPGGLIERFTGPAPAALTALLLWLSPVSVRGNSPTSTVLVPDAAGRHHRLMECVPA